MLKLNQMDPHLLCRRSFAFLVSKTRSRNFSKYLTWTLNHLITKINHNYKAKLSLVILGKIRLVKKARWFPRATDNKNYQTRLDHHPQRHPLECWVNSTNLLERPNTGDLKYQEITIQSIRFFFHFQKAEKVSTKTLISTKSLIC